MSNLIERLDAIKALVPEIGMANCEGPIDDAIAALSPVLPDEVEQFLGDLQSDVYTCPTISEIVNFIKRLTAPVLPDEVAEEIEALRKLAKLQGNGLLAEHSHADKTADLIERLARGSRLAKAMATAADNEKALNNKLQQRIEAYEKALEDIRVQFPITHPAGWAANKALAGTGEDSK